MRNLWRSHARVWSPVLLALCVTALYADDRSGCR